MQLETPLRCKLQEKIASCDMALTKKVIIYFTKSKYFYFLEKKYFVASKYSCFFLPKVSVHEMKIKFVLFKRTLEMIKELHL